MSGSYTNTDGRSDSLDAAAAHDTGLYDPARHDNQIVALYETQAQAQAAQERLVAAGVAAGAMQVLGAGSAAGAGAAVSERTTAATESGFWGALKSLFVPDEDATAYHHAISRGHAMLVVSPERVADRSHLIQLLESTHPIDFDAKLEEWRQAGYDYSAMPARGGTGASAPAAGPAGFDSETGTTGVAAPRVAAGAANTADTGYRPGSASTGVPPSAGVAQGAAPAGATANTIPLMEERLRVGKRELPQGAVRVRSYVVERPVEEQVRLRQEHVSIERHPVDRPAAAGETGAFQERTIEARATSEEAVVNKTAHVVEEIGIRKDSSERTETVRDTVRHTEVDVNDTTGDHRPLQTGGSVTNATPGATTSGANAPRK